MKTTATKVRRLGSTRRHHGERNLTLESLEQRWPLAGNVLAALSAVGDLSIKGDAAENEIAIFVTGGNLTVQGNNGTTINGAAANFSQPVGAGLRNVSIDLGAATTPLGRERFNRGVSGADRVAMDGLALSGSLAIKGSGAGVIEVFTTTVTGPTSIVFGTGVSDAVRAGITYLYKDGSLIRLGDNQFGTAVNDLTITTGASNDQIVLGDNTIGRDLKITSNAGDDRVDVGGSFSLGGVVTIGRNLLIDAKAGQDDVGCEIDTAGAATIKTNSGDDHVFLTGEVGGNLSVDLGPAGCLGFNGLMLDGLQVGGNALLKGGAQDDDMHLYASPIFGSLTINLGGGDAILDMVESDVGGFTKIDVGKGNADIILGDLTLGAGTFGGEVAINLGNGDFNALAILGPAVYLGGDLFDPSSFAAGTVFQGNVTIKGGKGEDGIGIMGAMLTRGNLSIDTGNGNDLIGATDLFVGSNLTVKSGNGNDVVAMGLLPGSIGNLVLGSTLVDAGNGNDFVAAQYSLLHGPVSVKLGAGNDVLVAEELQLDSSLSVDGGAGAADVASFDDDSIDVAGAISAINFEFFDPPGPLPTGFDEAAIIDHIFATAGDFFPYLIPLFP